MQSEELKKYVTEIIEQKKLSGVDQDIKDKLIDDLTNRLQEQINRALINALNDEQFKEFEKLVDAEDAEKVSTFFADNNIPVQEITTQVLVKFRVAYLGSQAIMSETIDSPPPVSTMDDGVVSLTEEELMQRIADGANPGEDVSKLTEEELMARIGDSITGESQKTEGSEYKLKPVEEKDFKDMMDRNPDILDPEDPDSL